MRVLRLKKASRRQYIVTVVQDHHKNQTSPFVVSVRRIGQPTVFAEDGKDLFGLLNKAAEDIYTREEDAPGTLG